MQHWVRFWFDDALRLQAAKAFQQTRIERVRTFWKTSRLLRDEGFEIDPAALDTALVHALQCADSAPDQTNLLLDEARLTKQLYQFAARAVNYGEFVRGQRGSASDPANRFLDHGPSTTKQLG